MKRIIQTFTMILVFCIGVSQSVLAQLMEVDGLAFSETAQRTEFTELRVGSDATEVYTALGVRFLGENGTAPRGDEVLIPGGLAATRVLMNEAQNGSSAGSALILRFDFPVVRAGFTLGNGSETTVATITALTPSGALLGSIQKGDIDPLLDPFVAVETSHPAGIGTLLVDYGDEPNAERLDGLVFDYLQPRVFSTYLAQIAAGSAGGISIETIVQVQNLLFDTTEATVRFFEQDGDPWVLQVNGEERSEISLELRRVSSQRLRLTADAITQAGYACIESNKPVKGVAIYRVSNLAPQQEQQTEVLISEAGVGSDGAKIAQGIAVEKFVSQSLDTGIALANPGDSQAAVRLVLVDEMGARPEGFRNSIVLELLPGTHLAFFLSQYCTFGTIPQNCITDFLRDGDFQGSIFVQSDQPIAVTTLRTIDGFPRASLPAGSTQK